MEFGPAATILVMATIFGVAVLSDRYVTWRRWRESLVAYHLTFPADLSVDAVSQCLSIVSGMTRRQPIVFEITGTARGIRHLLLVPQSMGPGVVSRLTSALPGIRVIETLKYLADRPRIGAACELRTSHAWWPLAADRAESSVTGLLSSLFPVGVGECVRIQWTISGTHHSHTGGDIPPEIVREMRAKQSTPLVDAVGRVAVSAAHTARCRMLMVGVLSALHVVAAPGVSLTTRRLPWRLVARRVNARRWPFTVWPARLNVAELAAVVGIPVGGVRVPGLTTGTARQLPPAPDMPRTGLVIGSSNYPGVSRDLALRTEDRLRHMAIQGPTGTGKSTLIANMALQDIHAGRGVLVVDPKSDLIEEILSRVPDDRAEDVVVIDPSKTDRPIGLNILECGNDEQSRELVADRVVHIFSELWRSSWGPRTADVIRSCVLTLTHTRAHDGSAFTLAEVPELLTNEAFRRYVTAQVSVPHGVRDFWAMYEAMSDGERAQTIGPTMNKIRAILTRTSLRLMLGQSAGLDLSTLFRERRIVLVPLASGVIGVDAARLLGSLLVAILWQETLGRARVPADRRHAVFGYLDEFQEFVRWGGDELADILAQSRSLGLGLVLAHQYLDQLPGNVLSAVLGTVRSQLVFQMSYTDAAATAKRFPPLGVEDLTNLGAYEMALRPCVAARTLGPVTGVTHPLPEPLRTPERLAEYARYRYGTPRGDVEDARLSRIRSKPHLVTAFGRKAQS